MNKKSLKELKERYKDLYCSIYQTECYSAQDFHNFLACEAELARRGVKISLEPAFY